MKLRAGHGYWCVDYYPMGGDFRRAPKGVDCELVDVEQLERPYKGCTHKAWIQIPGQKIRHSAVFCIAHTID